MEIEEKEMRNRRMIASEVRRKQRDMAETPQFRVPGRNYGLASHSRGIGCRPDAAERRKERRPIATGWIDGINSCFRS